MAGRFKGERAEFNTIVMAGFVQRVYGMPVMFLRTETLVSCRRGVQKRLRKEQNLLYAAPFEEKEYTAKRKDNIRRLRIIRDELKRLEKEL